MSRPLGALSPVSSGVALIAALALSACDGGSLNQGIEKFSDTGSADGTDGTDGTDGADGGADGGGADGGGGDGGGGDGGEPTPCSNAWDPVHEVGWTKTFAVTYQGGTGTGTMTSTGPIASHPAAGAGDVYGVRETITTTAGGYDLTFSIGCDTEGEGLYVHDYTGTYETVLFELLPLTGAFSSTFSPGRRYLPAEYEVGFASIWNYSYSSTMQLSIDDGTGGGEVQTGVVTFTGSFTEYGTENTLMLGSGDTVMAYKLVNTFTSSGLPPFGVTVPVEGYFEQWYVKGLGLVKEASYDNANPSTPLLTKDLQSWLGLSIIED
jgi:hypothetical protein